MIEFGARFKDGGRAKFDVIGGCLEIAGLGTQFEPAATFMCIAPQGFLHRSAEAQEFSRQRVSKLLEVEIGYFVLCRIVQRRNENGFIRN